MPTYKVSASQFIHITDTHLLDNSGELFQEIDTKESFKKVLIQSQHNYPNADFILLTGDISQTGSDASYRLLASVLEHSRLPIYCVPGNHDTPVLLKSVFPHCPDDSISVIHFDHYVLLLVNSWDKGGHRGLISDRSLFQIRELFTNQSFDLVVVAVHHPPIPVGSKWLDELGLQNREEFLRTIDSDSRETILLCGHVHQEIDTMWRGVHILGTPSTCHQFAKNSPHISIVKDQPPAYRIVDISGQGLVKTMIHYVE